jgi:hypothetical protein
MSDDIKPPTVFQRFNTGSDLYLLSDFPELSIPFARHLCSHNLIDLN